MPTDRDYWKPDRVVMRRKAHTRRALFNKNRILALLSLILAGFLWWGLYLLLHLSAVQVVSIEVSGTETLSQNDIQSSLESLIAGDRWHLVPRRNIFFISTASLEKTLKSSIPTITEVHIKKVFPRALDVTIRERELWAIYCAGEYAIEIVSTSTLAVASPVEIAGLANGRPTESDFSNCYMLDRDGVLYQPAPSVEGSLLLQVRSDEFPSSNDLLGVKSLDPGLIVNLALLSDETREVLGFGVSAFELHKNSPKDVWFEAPERFRVVLTRGSDYREALKTVKTVLDNQIRDRRNALEYIDARFGTRVYYKLRP